MSCVAALLVFLPTLTAYMGVNVVCGGARGVPPDVVDPAAPGWPLRLVPPATPPYKRSFAGIAHDRASSPPGGGSTATAPIVNELP